jgi:hypothetical protein
LIYDGFVDKVRQLKKFFILGLFCLWVASFGVIIVRASLLFDHNTNNDSQATDFLRKLPSGLILKKSISKVGVVAFVLSVFPVETSFSPTVEINLFRYLNPISFSSSRNTLRLFQLFSNYRL